MYRCAVARSYSHGQFEAAPPSESVLFVMACTYRHWSVPPFRFSIETEFDTPPSWTIPAMSTVPVPATVRRPSPPDAVREPQSVREIARPPLLYVFLSVPPRTSAEALPPRYLMPMQRDMAYSPPFSSNTP